MFDYDGQSFGERTIFQKQQHITQMKLFMDWFEQTFHLDIYLMYGTLLGAYREQTFLEHDFDIDLAYLSAKTDIDDIVEEKNHIIKTLQKENLLLKTFNNGHFHVISFDKSVALDMWTSWFDKDNMYYAVSAYDAWVKKEDVYPFKTIKFGDMIDFKIPCNTDKFLTAYYGDWKTPKTTWQQSTKYIHLPTSKEI